MKHLVFAMLTLIIFSVPCVLADDEYYYLYGQRMPLAPTPDKITVKLDMTQFTGWADFMSAYPEVNNEMAPNEITGAAAYLLHLKEGKDANAVLYRLRTDPRVAIASHVYWQAEGRDIYIGGDLLIKFSKQFHDNIDSFLAVYGLRRVRTAFKDNMAIVTEMAKSSASPIAIANQVYETGLVEGVGPDFVLPFVPFAIPNDIDYPAQYNLHNMDMPLVWELTIPTTAITVGVLDDAVEAHEDIDSSRWLPGYDYLLDTLGASPQGCTFCYHGMAVCGIIGATQNNDSMGVAGMAGREGIRILPHRVFRELSRYGTADFASSGAIQQAIQDAVDSNASVINISWGMLSIYRPECAWLYNIDCALRYADSLGVLVVCASGNGCDDTDFYCSPPAYPACFPTTFAVGALNHMDSLNPCSQYGEKLDVVAYGEYIPTTDRMGDNGFVGNQQASKREDVCDLDPNYDCVFDGTSAAAPQVTAIAALILQKRPDLIGQADILKRILRYTAENPWGPTTDTARLNDQIGWGRVNAFEALLAVSRGDANNDGNIDVADATYIVNYIYSNGPAPQPDPRMGDANCDATVNVGDAVHIVNYIFRGGPAPCICYKDMYCD